MKFMELRNDSGKRIAITAVRGLVFIPGEVKKVSPATVKHPAVSSYIGRGLTLVISTPGEEPIAPIPTVTKSPEPETVVAEPTPEPEPSVMEAPMETADALQEAYLAAPGVTEENIQAIKNAFPSPSDLVNASLADIQDAAGLSKSASRALKSWAASQAT